MLVLGSGTYWKRLQHRFDALTAALVVVGQIIIRAAIAHDVPLCDVIQYVLLLRLTRTLRLVVLVRRFNEIFGTFVDLIPAFSTLFGMMWTVFSVFASVGMVLFGGKIRYSSVALNGTRECYEGHPRTLSEWRYCSMASDRTYGYSTVLLNKYIITIQYSTAIRYCSST